MRTFALVALLIALINQSNAQRFSFVDASTWRTGPLVSYTFSQPIDQTINPTINASRTFSWSSQLEERYGIATLNGIDQTINLQEYADDNGRLLPTNQLTDQTIELSIQLLEFEPSTIFELGDDINQSIKLSLNQAIANIDTLVGTVFNNQAINQVQCYGCANGSWAHIVMTIQLTNPSSNQGSINLYLNGQTIASTLATLPASGLLRPSQYIGRPSVIQSSNQNNLYLNANLDSFFIYNYPLSAAAIKAHAALDLPPVFELDFAVNPIIRAGLGLPGAPNAATYIWAAAETPSRPPFPYYSQGSLSLPGPNFFVNLSTLSTTSTVATLLPTIGVRANSGAGADPLARGGWAFEMALRTNSPMESNIIDWAVSSSDSSNSILLSISNNAELVFTINNQLVSQSIICMTDFNPDQSISHLVVSITPSGFAQCYMNGRMTASMTNFPLPAFVARQSALIGRSNNFANNQGFNGAIYLVRVHDMSLSSDQVESLYDIFTPPPPSSSEFVYQSGPLVQYQFDQPRQFGESTDPSNNQYSWRPVANFPDTTVRSTVYVDQASQSSDLTIRHSGLACVDQSIDQSSTQPSNQYINLNYDADSRGQTLPLYIGQSLSFELWVLIDRVLTSVDRLTIFDFADQSVSESNVGTIIDRLSLTVDAAGSLSFAWMDINQVSSQMVAQSVVRPFEWTHIAVTIQSVDPSINQSNFSIIVNGINQSNRLSTSINRSMRRLAYLGKSVTQTTNQAANQFIGFFDSFYLYNFALSTSQVGLHLSINQPPSFDCSFETNPQLISDLNPTLDPFNYGWVDQSAGHSGVLGFDGLAQYVDLTANQGPSSVGEPFPIIGPVDQSVYQSANQQNTSKVLSLEAAFNFQSIGQWLNQSIFEFSNNGPVDMISLHTIDQSVVLSIDNGMTGQQFVCLVVPVVTVNTWYHVAVVIESIDQSMGQYRVYLDGVSINQSVNVMPQSIRRNYAALARSSQAVDAPAFPMPGENPLSNGYFSGMIDRLRIYQSALTSQQVQLLANRLDWSINRSIRIEVSSSSSTAGPSRPVVSSSARSSSAVSSSTQSSSARSSSAPSSSVVSSSAAPSSSPAVSSSAQSSSARSSSAQSSSAVSSSAVSSSAQSSSARSSSAQSSSAQSSSTQSSSAQSSSVAAVQSSSAAPSSSTQSSSASPSSSARSSSAQSSSAQSSSAQSSSAQSSSASPSSSAVPLIPTAVSSSVLSSSAVSSSARSSSAQSSSAQSSSAQSSSARSSSAQSSSATPSSSLAAAVSSSVMSSSAQSSSVAPSSSARSSSAQSSSAQSSSAQSSSAQSSSAQSSSARSSSAQSSSAPVSSSAAQSSSVAVPGASSSFRSSSSVFSSLSSSVRSSSSSAVDQSVSSSVNQASSSAGAVPPVDPASSSSSSTAGSDPVFTDDSSSSSSLSSGSLAAAIVVPVVVGLCLLITAAVFFLKRHNNQAVKQSGDAAAYKSKPVAGTVAGNQVNHGYTYGNGADTTVDADDATVQVVELERMPVD